MDYFKTQVTLWLKLDTDLTRLQTALRERREAKRELTQGILAFMLRFGIDDLDTLECKLSYKVRQVKTPLPHRLIHDRIAGIYAHDPVTARSITNTVFNRDRVQKVSLRKSPSGSARSPV